MRPITWVTLLLTIASAQAAAQSPLDTRFVRIELLPFLDPCAVSPFLGRIAREAHLSMGFERALDGCAPSDATIPRDGVPVTVRSALDHLAAVAPKYEWRDIGSVVVVRPAEAWNNRNHFLNQRVAPFSVTDKDLGPALSAIGVHLQMPTPPSMNAQFLTDTTEPVDSFTIAFQGGTIFDALNRIVSRRPDLGWLLGYCDEATAANAHITLTTHEPRQKRTRALPLHAPRGTECPQ
jgi:hypothetical protein